MIKLIKVDDKNKAVITFEIKLDDTEWKEYQKKALQNEAKRIKVEGFRPGKAPLDVVKKQVHPEQLLFKACDRAVHTMVDELSKLPEFQKVDREVHPTPDLEVVEMTDEILKVAIKYFSIPKVSLPNYKKLDVKLEKVSITDKEIQDQIDQTLAREKMVSPKNGPIAKGDIAVFDFTGYKDDKKFDGGEALKYELEIGSNNFIPGFEDQMVGLKVGDQKDLKLSFPKSYHVADLAGQPVIFKVKINEVKKIEKPKFDDTFVKSLKINDVNTTAEFKDYIKKSINSFKQKDVSDKNIVAINKAIAKASKLEFEIPDVVLNDEIKNVSQRFTSTLESMKMKRSDYLKYIGLSEDEIQKQLATQARENVIVYSALDYINEIEKISLTDAEINEKFIELSKVYNTSVDKIKNVLGSEAAKDAFIHEKIMQKVIDWNLKKAK